MGNGVDFQALAVDLRKQLGASEASKAELLEALEWLHGVACNQLGDDWTAVVNAARVIRKARGESQ